MKHTPTATEPPDTWQPEPQDLPTKSATALTKAAVVQAMLDGKDRWLASLARVAGRDALDTLMEARDAYRLLADQAQLHADLTERIK